jgi:hypothetical protein
METALLCAILGSQTVTILVQWLLSKIDAKRNPLRDGVKELLFCKLKQFDEQREHNGFMPIADKETVERVYTAYHALGGNGVGTEITNKIRTCASSRGGNETKAET